jgi:hypothetical protein
MEQKNKNRKPRKTTGPSRRGKTTANETAAAAAAEAAAAGQHDKISAHRRWSHTKELATSWHRRPLY